MQPVSGACGGAGEGGGNGGVFSEHTGVTSSHDSGQLLISRDKSTPIASSQLVSAKSLQMYPLSSSSGLSKHRGVYARTGGDAGGAGGDGAVSGGGGDGGGKRRGERGGLAIFNAMGEGSDAGERAVGLQGCETRSTSLEKSRYKAPLQRVPIKSYLRVRHLSSTRSANTFRRLNEPELRSHSNHYSTHYLSI